MAAMKSDVISTLSGAFNRAIKQLYSLLLPTLNEGVVEQ